MNVYKYCPPERIDILKKGMICFSPPLAFNDPFESFPDMTKTSNDSFINTVNLSAQEHGWSATQKNLGRILQQTDAKWQTIQEAVGNSQRVLCLSEQRNNLLMWAHYTTSHKGFVLGFDSNHEFFNMNAFKKTAWKSGLRKVIYSPDRPIGPTVDEISTVDIETIMSVYLTKSDAWAYEQEWRMTALRHHASDVTPQDACLYSFPATALTEVILGYRASDETKQVIVDNLKAYPLAKLYQAKLHLHKFILEIERVTS